MSPKAEARIHAAFAELAEALIAGLSEPVVDEAQLFTVEQAARRLAIGRSLFYELIAQGKVRSMRVGRRRVVSYGALAEYAAQAPPRGTN